MKNIKIYLIGIILLLAIGVYTSSIIYTSNKVKQYKATISSLEKEKQILLEENTNLKLKVTQFKDTITLLDKKVDSIHLKLTDLYEDTNKTLDSISKLSNDKLQQFFTDRYLSSGSQD